MSWFGAFLDAIKLRARYVWAIAISAGFLLFVPPPISGWLRLDAARETAGPALGVVFVVATVFAMVRTYDFFEDQKGKKVHNQLLRDRLSRLNPGEAGILLEALRDDRQTVNAALHGSTTMSLVHKGFLEAAPVNAAGGFAGAWPHTIPDEVWSQLVEMREELERRASPANVAP